MTLPADWTLVGVAQAAYWARRATSGESVTPGEARLALAAGALEVLEPKGLKDAYPHWNGEILRGFGSDPPFWFTRPIPDAPARLEQLTLGGHAALGAVPGGEVIWHEPMDCCIALGPSNGDIGELTRLRDEWVWHLAWFFSLNRSLGGLADVTTIENTGPSTRDIKWGGDWYCLVWPIVVQLRYVMPASG